MLKIEMLRTCDILLYKGSDFTSKLIQWGTNSPYNHVAVVADPGANLAIESNTGHQSGVRALDLRKLDEEGVDIFRVRAEYLYDPGKTISYLVSCLGSDYDLGGVIGLAALKMVGLITLGQYKGYNRFQKDRDYFCSELCYAAFNEGGLDIVPQVAEADITSPGDIARSERIEKLDLN